MSFNTLSHSQHRTNSLSHTTLTRPNVTFNYVNAKTNTSVIDWDHNKNKVVSFNRPLFSNIHHPNRQVVPKMQKIKTGNQILSHRDHKRRKIFAKSQSNNDLGNLSYANSIQNYREFIENRQPSDMNEVKSKSSRRRNNIFQSYNPKSRIQSTKPQIFKNETSKVITSNAFDRPIHPRKLTNYMQLTPNRAPKILNQQSPVTKLSAQKYIKKIPLRDTYVAERDYQAKIISQNQQEPKNILQKEMYEIQLGKQDRSFNKKLQVGQLFNKSKNNLQNLQFQEESIIGYSQQQTHPHDQQTQDIPQLLLETNDRMMAKTQKSEQNKSKGELSSLVDIRLHTTVVSDKSQVFSKIVNKPIEQPSNIVQTPPSKSVLQNMPYLLVILGVLLLLIQLLK